jgi:hypothetical protein
VIEEYENTYIIMSEHEEKAGIAQPLEHLASIL